MKKNKIITLLIIFISAPAFTQNKIAVDNNSYSTELSLNGYSLYNTFDLNRNLSKLNSNNKWGKINNTPLSEYEEFETWESKKRFGAAVGELAIIEFIPWAMARWLRVLWA